MKPKHKLTAFEKFRRAYRSCLRVHELSDTLQQIATETLAISTEHREDGYTDSPGELEYLALRLSEIVREARRKGW